MADDPSIPDPGASPSGPYWLYAVAYATVMLVGHGLGSLVEMEAVRNPDSLDDSVAQWVLRQRASWLGTTRFALMVTRLGDPDVATTAVVLIALVILGLRHHGLVRIRKDDAVFYVVVLGGGRLIAILLKLWFQRIRPAVEHRLVPESTFSFPSGHGVFAGEVLLLLTMIVLRHGRGMPGWSRATLIVLGVGVTVAVAASRVWLTVHYLTDVLAGFLLGALWAGLAIGIRFGWGRRLRRRPA